MPNHFTTKSKSSKNSDRKILNSGRKNFRHTGIHSNLRSLLNKMKSEDSYTR